MGLFDRAKELLSGGPTRSALLLEGGGQRRLAGASHYDSSYRAVVRANPKTDRARHPFTARVVTEPDNPHDRNAVAVYWHRHQLGHLSAEQAAEWQPVIAEVEAAGYEVHAEAAVVAGFDGGTWGAFVRLPKPDAIRRQLVDAQER